MKKIKILSKLNKKIAKMNDNYLISEAKKQFLLFEEIAEGIDEEGKHDGKYYAFDWDDNLIEMPTEIILKGEKGDEVGMSTADFAEYREEIGKKEFKYKGKTITGYAENPFRFFRHPTGDEQFLKDTLIAPTAPAWPAFVKCLNGGSIFAIITARGHDPNTLRLATKALIDVNHKGISKESVVKNINIYRKLSGDGGPLDPEQALEYYLGSSEPGNPATGLCRFHPVSFGAGSAANPEAAKVKAFGDFMKYVKALPINKGVDVKVGFSDDDAANIEAMEKHFGDEPNLSIIYTGPEKEEVKEQTEPYQKEVAKKHNKMKIRLIGVGGRSKSAPPMGESIKAVSSLDPKKLSQNKVNLQIKLPRKVRKTLINSVANALSGDLDSLKKAKKTLSPYLKNSVLANELGPLLVATGLSELTEVSKGEYVKNIKKQGVSDMALVLLSQILTKAGLDTGLSSENIITLSAIYNPDNFISKKPSKPPTDPSEFAPPPDYRPNIPSRESSPALSSGEETSTKPESSPSNKLKALSKGKINVALNQLRNRGKISAKTISKAVDDTIKDISKTAGPQKSNFLEKDVPVIKQIKKELVKILSGDFSSLKENHTEDLYVHPITHKIINELLNKK